MASAAAATGFAPGLEMISVHDVQEQLIARGYYPGPADGVANEATIRAILAFERDYGLPTDGIAGPVVQNMLHFLPMRPKPALLASLAPPTAMAPPSAPALVVVPRPPSPPVANLPPAPAETATVPPATPTARRLPDRRAVGATIASAADSRPIAAAAPP
ncbi:MAG: peptidoglycan-binding domain-containing protein, partial [Stellaceae bacterium]